MDGLVELIDARLKPCENTVKINVAGTVFTTSRATIAKGSEHLQSLVLPEGRNVQLDEQGLPFIDVNPAAFQGILQFLRQGWILIKNLGGGQGRQSLYYRVIRAGVASTEEEEEEEELKHYDQYCNLDPILQVGILLHSFFFGIHRPP